MAHKAGRQLISVGKNTGLIYRVYLFIEQIFASPGDGLRWIWPKDSGSSLLLVPVSIIKRDLIISWNLVIQKYISFVEVISSRVSTQPQWLHGWSWADAAPNLIFPSMTMCFILLLIWFSSEAGKGWEDMENPFLPLTLGWCVTSGTWLCLFMCCSPHLQYENNHPRLLRVSTLTSLRKGQI